MIRPVRLQLSRRKGFNLQAASLAINGLYCINVTRPGRWGNIFSVGLVACNCRSAGECSHNTFNRETAAEAVADHRAIQRSEKRIAQIKAVFRGMNVACCCGLDQPCHGDTYLEIAGEKFSMTDFQQPPPHTGSPKES